MWTVIGDLDGIPVKVSFDQTLQADRHVLGELADYAGLIGYVGTTPVGPWLEANLADESGAFLVVCERMTHIQVIAGEVPPLPEASPLQPGEVS